MEQMMRVSEGEWYRIYTLDGIPDAIVTDKEEMTLEECRKLIDERNAWAQGNAAAADVGCKPKQFLIVKHIWNRWHFPDGRFIESNYKNKAFEVYPSSV